MTQNRTKRAQPSARELTNTISSDWRELTKHLNDLGLLLISRKNVRIALRVGIALLCTLLFVFIRHQIDNQPIVGDQPHYVLMDYSLKHDHDFNLANNFAHHDSNTFGIYPPDGLTAGGQVGPGQVHTPSHQYSIHGIGVPLMLLPGYIVAGVPGMQLEMILVAVGVLYLTYYWCKIVAKSIKLSFIAAFALFVSYLFYGLVGYIFPDMIIGAIIVATFIILAKAPESPLWQLVLGLMLGFGVLVHYKMLAFAGPVALILCYITWKQNRKLPFATLVPLAFFGALLLYLTHKWFGIWNPSGVLADVGVGLHPSSFFNNVSAVLFDAARGLIANSPIILLVFVGLPIWFRRDRSMMLMMALAIAIPVAGYVMFSDWGGGDAPTGRYAMNFLPLLMPAAALTVQYFRSTWQRVVIVALFVATIAITLYYINIQKGWLGVVSPTSSPIFSNTALAFDRWFPNFNIATNLMGHFDWAKVAVDYVLLLGAVAYGYIVSGRSSEQSLARK